MSSFSQLNTCRVLLLRYSTLRVSSLTANSRAASSRCPHLYSYFDQTRTPSVSRHYGRANTPLYAHLNVQSAESTLLVSCAARSLCSSSSSTSDDEAWNCYHEEMVERVRQGDATIVDVRRADEVQETGMIPGAHHIPLDELKEAFALPGDKFEKRYGLPLPEGEGSELIFSCRSGVRSLTALGIAREAGFTQARHYPGGWLQWAESQTEP